ncbi:MAG TPA: trypsin-like peptidase domain-containing protein [bacterium]|nr:trypsin-like peptidase domain-containing protein [bacterium]
MKKAIGCLFAVILLSAAPLFAGDESLRQSVVKIFTVTNKPNYYQPWVIGYQFEASGSGCILPGKRILTNAHVVSDEVFIQVMKAGDTKKYTAEVEYVDHDREVAVLRVKDGSFFKGTRPVEFGALPSQRDKVAVYGFPIGGDELSITEGVVSRIEVQRYVHSQRDFLTIQTDAAINPGNSGGPAFEGGKLIGIAFQSYGGDTAQGIGYIVPMPVIERSLKDRAAGNLTGAPSLGILWQKMESDSLRDFYKMKPDQSGVLVTQVVYGSPADGVVKARDVLLSEAGVPIANNGTIPFAGGNRLAFSYLTSRYANGDQVPLEVLRDGKVVKLTLKLKPFDPLVAGPAYDVRPSYYIFGGIVFMPLSWDYLNLWKSGTAPSQLMDLYENGLPSPSRKQVVFINEVLPDDLNVGYHDLKQVVVDKIDGMPITQLSDVPLAFQHPIHGYHVIELDETEGDGADAGGQVVFAADGAEKATREIMKSFGISKDRSDDLLGDGVTPLLPEGGAPVTNTPGALGGKLHL